MASDYSVTAGGFTGGLVQITTRSGGNEWKSAVFHYLHHDGLVGRRHDGGQFAPAPFSETETGVGALEFDLAPAQVAGTELEGLLTEPITLTVGCDRFGHANEYEDERVQIYADIDYLFRDHLFKAGVEVERFDLYKLFVPGSRGRFVFDGLEAVLGGVARVDYVNAVSNDSGDAAADWGYRRHALFVQDAWTVSPELELTAGLRYERAIGPLNTRIDVFGRILSGRLFTYTFDVDAAPALTGDAPRTAAGAALTASTVSTTSIRNPGRSRAAPGPCTGYAWGYGSSSEGGETGKCFVFCCPSIFRLTQICEIHEALAV